MGDVNSTNSDDKTDLELLKQEIKKVIPILQEIISDKFDFSKNFGDDKLQTLIKTKDYGIQLLQELNKNEQKYHQNTNPDDITPGPEVPDEITPDADNPVPDGTQSGTDGTQSGTDGTQSGTDGTPSGTDGTPSGTDGTPSGTNEQSNNKVGGKKKTTLSKSKSKRIRKTKNTLKNKKNKNNKKNKKNNNNKKRKQP